MWLAILIDDLHTDYGLCELLDMQWGWQREKNLACWCFTCSHAVQHDHLCRPTNMRWSMQLHHILYIYIINRVCSNRLSFTPSQVPGFQMKPVMKARGLHIDMACLGGIRWYVPIAATYIYIVTLLQVMIALEPHRISLMSSWKDLKLGTLVAIE